MIRLKTTLSLSAAALALVAAGAARADTATPAVEADASEAIVVTAKATRSATAISSAEIQKILPGISPLKAIQTLPGVLYITADPWGNNEQNAQLYIHGFSVSQLGYTMDGVPLGDQNYGNFNGLSPQRAVMSENVARTVVATGAGELGIASTSNLGGAVTVFSRDPADVRGIELVQTGGSYGTSRTYARLDTGDMGGNNKLYLAGDRQRARAWDFAGIQGGYQANGKFTHEDSLGKLTLYFDYSDKIEPNEDATTISASLPYQPYTRPYMYPNFSATRGYVDAYGNTPAAQGGNYNNYYSDAQRTDYLAYAKYDLNLGSHVKWANQIYYHHNDGVGVVAGPLGQSITVVQPYLDPAYGTDATLKGNANTMASLVAATGGSGYVTRTTEYRIMRKGVISTLNADIGAHALEAGVWYQYNSSHAFRNWYALDINNVDASSPYIRPSNPLFTQYDAEMRVDTLQMHLQDSWKLSPRASLEAGFKTSGQYAYGYFPVMPKAGSFAGLSGALPQGRIDTNFWFLPTVGGKFDVTDAETVYFNVQKNARQFQAYGGGGSADPWSTSSQAAFDTLKNNGKPETSWVYEAGLRTHRQIEAGWLLTGYEGQINFYHVDFSNRLLSVSAAPGGIAGGSITGGTTSLFNVGSVKTNGVDAAFTLHFGREFSLYNATSFNSSVYQSDYSTATGGATGTRIGGIATVNNVVPTGGKQVPGTPKWMNKTVATLALGDFEAQLIGDYVGPRYATYVNDLRVGHYFLTSLRLAEKLPADLFHMKKAEFSVNVTNLGNIQGTSTISIGNAGSYSAYPIAPREVYATLALGF